MTTPPLSVADLEARLERELALHEEREGFHAAQEASHRAQREHHAAERRRAEAELAAIRSAKPAAVPARKISLAAAIEEVLDSKAPGEAFTSLDLAPEVNERFGEQLGGPLDAAQVANFLRRLRADGHLEVVAEGRPHHPAVYRWPSPK